MNRSRGRSLFVRWIPDDTRPHELRSVFSKYGVVNDVYIPRDYYTNKPRGFAYIEFENSRDAQDAVRDSSVIKLNGRYLDIDYAQGDRKTPNEMKGRPLSDPSDSDCTYRRESRRRSSSSSDRRLNRRSERKRSRSRSRTRSRSRSPSRNNRNKRQRSISPKYSKYNSYDNREMRKYDSDKHKRYRMHGPMDGLDLDPFY